MANYKNEDRLQTAFINWFSQQEDYQETFNDLDSDKNTSVDSTGFIAERPVLIEFKLRISSVKVIERKIYAALRSLHGVEAGYNQKVRNALSAWNRKSIPHIMIVAEAISEKAKAQLEQLLRTRTQEWQFNCTLWVWQDANNYERLLHLEQFDDYAQADDFPSIATIPSIPRGKRSPLALTEFAELAESNGVGKLFEAMCIRIEQLHGVPQRGATTLNFKFPPRDATPRGGVVSMRPGVSSAVHGLLIGYKLALLQEPLDENRLPGAAQEPKVGWLDKSRWLRTVEEVNMFWDIISAPKL